MRCLWTATFTFLTLIGLLTQDATAQRSDRQSRHSEHHAARPQAGDDADDVDDDEDDDDDDDRYERDDDDDREQAGRDDDRRSDRYTSQYGNDRTRTSRDYGGDRNPQIATDRNPGDQRRSRITERQSLSRSHDSAGDYSDGMWRRALSSKSRKPAGWYQDDDTKEGESEEWPESMAESSESETVGERNERFASSADEFIRQNDEDEDNYLSHDEMPQGMLENFHDLDRDGDNYVGRTELQQHGRNMLQWMRAAHDTASQGRGNVGTSSRGGRVVPVEVTYVWIMDADGGHIRLNDLQGAYDLLQRLDANNDGNITRSELRDRKQQVVSRWIEHGFNRLDENEDDAISRNEAYQTMLQERFDRLDLNGDDELTRGELRRTAENASRWWGPQDEDAYLSEGQVDDQRR